MVELCDGEVLCRNITLLRKLNRITQKQMAALMEVSVYCVRKTEQGQLSSGLSTDAILRLGKYFNLNPSVLFAPMTKLSDLIKDKAV